MAKQYLKVGFDQKVEDKRVYKKTESIETVSKDIFAYLNILSSVMPELTFIDQWETKKIGHKEPRYHGDLHEIVFVMNGKGQYRINDKYISVQAKDVILIKPNEVHRYTDSSDMECISLHFSFIHLDELKKQLKSVKRKKQQDEFMAFLMNHYPEINKISLVHGSHVHVKARQLYQEFQTPGAGSQLLINLYFVEILVLLARNYLYAKTGDNLPSQQVNKRDEIMVRQIIAYLDEHFTDHINHDELFQNYYLHTNYCRNIFKKIAGVSVSIYLTKKRMDHARHLVLESEFTLEEIASKVGIADYFYFLRAFKKAFGVSPGTFRKNPNR